jgi:hypothetical protein
MRKLGKEIIYVIGGNFMSQATTSWLIYEYNDTSISMQSGKHVTSLVKAKTIPHHIACFYCVVNIIL